MYGRRLLMLTVLQSLMLWCSLAFSPAHPSSYRRRLQSCRSGFHPATTWMKTRRAQRLLSSLFDPDDGDFPENSLRQRQEGTPTASRKFTGRTNNSNSSLDNNVRQDEYNLVQLATSPGAFLIQAAGILIVTIFVVYVGATGQLGMNRDYFDNDDDDIAVLNNFHDTTVRVQPPLMNDNELATSPRAMMVSPVDQSDDSSVWI